MGFPWRAKGRPRQRHTPGVMNKMEERYAAHLDRLMKAGEILWWKYESINLRLLGIKNWLKIDFFILPKNLVLEGHETKGRMEEDAQQKLKQVGVEYPWPIFVVKEMPQKDGGGWSYTSYGLPGELPGWLQLSGQPCEASMS